MSVNVNLNGDIMAQLKQVNFRRLIFVRRYLILSVTMCIVAVAMVLFAIFPQIQEIVETQSIIKAENSTLANLQRKIQGLAQVNDLEGYANKDKVDLALPFQKPLLPVLEAARRVSIETGASIVSIETTPGKIASLSAQNATGIGVNASGAAVVSTPIATQTLDSAGDQVHGVDKMDISVTIKGTLPQISDYITKIERATPITNVTEIRLDEDSRPADGPPVFSAALRLSAYYFTRAIQVAIDAPLPETGAKERQFLRDLDSYTVNQQNAPSSQVEGGGQNDLFGIAK